MSKMESEYYSNEFHKIQFNSIQKDFIGLDNCFTLKHAYVLLAFLALQ